MMMMMTMMSPINVCADEYACIGLSWAQYSVDNVVLSHKRALVGATLTASCDIVNEHKTRILVYWVRDTPNQRRVEISVNRGLNDDFSNSGRYSIGHVALNADMSHLQFQLNITGKPPRPPC